MTEQSVFFQELLTKGWKYFYQVLLAFFDELKEPIMKAEMFEILTLVKGNSSGGKKIYQNVQKKVDWSQILGKKHQSFEISKAFLSKMLNKDTNSVIIQKK